MAAVADFSITVGKASLSTSAKAQVLAVEADQSLTMPDRIEVTFADSDGERSADSSFKLGTEIKVSLGWVGSLEQVGVGTIARLDATRSTKGGELKVTAYGGRYALQRASAARAFVDTTIDSGVSEVTSGLGPSVTTQGSSVSTSYLMQGGQSAGRFLEEWAGREGKVIVQESTGLKVTAPSLSTASRTLTWLEDVQDMRLEINTFHQVSAVQVSGVDLAAKAPVVGKAGPSQALDLMGGSRTGSAVAEEVFGEVELTVSDMPVRSKAEAEALAKALYNERLFRFVTGAGMILGDPTLKAGGVVELANFARRLDGRYYLTRVIHRLDALTGFTTRLHVCRPTIGS